MSKTFSVKILEAICKPVQVVISNYCLLINIVINFYLKTLQATFGNETGPIGVIWWLAQETVTDMNHSCHEDDEKN